MDLEITEYRLNLGRPLSPGEATHLRGFFGTAFADEERVHNHRTDGSLVYDYPRVQFKVLDRTAHLIGVGDGGGVVERLWRETEVARLGGAELPVLDATLTRRTEPFGESPEPIEYRFANPWLGLNQDNHRRYAAARAGTERRELLARVLVGNCLSLAKAFGLRVAARLVANASQLRPRVCRFKDVPMTGFEGAFAVNFHVPTGLGIGKSVSRGFGTVERIVSASPVG
jgi:hypothetical protein